MSVEGNPVRGVRRIDRVLAEDFLDGLTSAALTDVRAMRAEAEQEEVDLSYLRRLVQGRMDVIRADLAHRDDASSRGLIAGLTKLFADEARTPARGLGRHSTLEPSRTDSHRRYVEALMADVNLSDVSARTPEELAHSMTVLRDEEQKISVKRRDVQSVMDACSAEITRRYREGEAHVAALLPLQADEARGG